MANKRISEVPIGAFFSPNFGWLDDLDSLDAGSDEYTELETLLKGEVEVYSIVQSGETPLESSFLMAAMLLLSGQDAIRGLDFVVTMPKASVLCLTYKAKYHAELSKIAKLFGIAEKRHDK